MLVQLQTIVDTRVAGLRPHRSVCQPLEFSPFQSMFYIHTQKNWFFSRRDFFFHATLFLPNFKVLSFKAFHNVTQSHSFNTSPEETSLLPQLDQYPHLPPRVSCFSVSAHSVPLTKIRSSLCFLSQPTLKTHLQSCLVTNMAKCSRVRGFLDFPKFVISSATDFYFIKYLNDQWIMYRHQFSLLSNHMISKEPTVSHVSFIHRTAPPFCRRNVHTLWNTGRPSKNYKGELQENQFLSLSKLS